MNKYLGHRIKEYLKYKIRCQTNNKVSSSFILDFNKRVINSKFISPEIELLRDEMLSDKRVLRVEDLGAGSVTGSEKMRSVSSIAKNAVKQPKYASILHNIVDYYKPEDIVELGTSLGITSLYLQSATRNPIYTLEGSSEILKIAEENFSKFSSVKPITILGNFDITLDQVLPRLLPSFMIYIDGNHTYDATMRYFNNILNYCSPESFIVFDDIYWSPEMTEAWKNIIRDPKVSFSIDLYQLGIVFFQTNEPNNNFTLPSHCHKE